MNICRYTYSVLNVRLFFGFKKHRIRVIDYTIYRDKIKFQNIFFGDLENDLLDESISSAVIFFRLIFQE